MTAKSNKEIERHYFELFRKIYTLPQGQVKYGDKPDVIVEGQERIGIEVTNFFLERGELSESEQKQRRIRADVLKKAQLEYISSGGRYEISFSFNKEHPIQNSQKLIPRLVELIQKLEVSKTGGFSKYFLEDVPQLEFIYINPNLYNDPKWKNIQCYAGQMMSIPRLMEIVCEKENKGINYSKCNAYWLLVIVDPMDSAQDQEIQIEGVDIKSDFFEKIILYKPTFEHVLEFKKNLG
jgi:hypothetical protein